MSSITELLDLEDADIFISNTIVEGTTKTLVVETHPTVHYCPTCGFRMYSRGIRERLISHPVLQDGYKLNLLLKQRRWRCTNEACGYTSNEEFRFVSKRRRSTNAADMLIVTAFKDLSLSASAIAKKFNTSDTHVLEIFDRYVKLNRLPLTEIISVDEVHTDIPGEAPYSMVLQDFYTGDPIDLVRSRRSNVTEPYFAAIPKSERLNVKYLLSDMYNPYLSFVDKYFPNAVPVVDAFHVIQWINHSIDMYIRGLEKTFRERDRKKAEQKSLELGRPVTVAVSDELYLLKRYRFLVLSNQANIIYHSDVHMDNHFHRLMNTYNYEDALFRIAPRLRTLRDLKNEYISFNTRNAGQPMWAQVELDTLINKYYKCGDEIFVNFAGLLDKYRDPIINSFIMVEKKGPGGLYDSRLSNGPIESLNRKVKDLKRLGRGYGNFERFRNRFLYATRNNPVLDGTGNNDQVLYLEEDDNV